jgi:DNA-binding helix-hairpin-helix protein with protein kinase domain
MGTLRAGQVLKGAFSQLEYRVDEPFSEGGQGEVWSVVGGGARYAVKWYNAQVLKVDRGLYSRLKVLIDRGAPSSKFLWPFELVTLPDGTGLGYLMRIKKPGSVRIHELLSESVRPSFRVLATVGCLLTDALFALHSKGLAYQDLNAGNAFFDEHSGDVEVCDNDNVDIDGAPSVIGGVWEFQAPEVVLRQTGPTRSTDLHSLAVMLFRILHVGHPLLGRRELDFPNLRSQEAVRSLLGTNPIFVFDPKDASNRPVADRHGPVTAHWEIYPQFLRDLFTRAFTEGLADPIHGRVQETEWRRAMGRLRDAVFTCPDCGAENFYDAARLAQHRPTFDCWHCARALPSAPARIGLRRTGGNSGGRTTGDVAQVVILERGAKLFSHHNGGEYNFSKAIAEVTYASPENILQLRNSSDSNWTALADGAWMEIKPGAMIPVGNGLRIRFAQCEGEIKV